MKKPEIPLPKPVYVLTMDINHLLGLVNTPKKLVPHRTTDSHCVLIHRIVEDFPIKPIKHSLLAAYRMLGGPIELRGQVFFIFEITKQNGDGSLTHRKGVYRYASDSVLKHFFARPEAIERCLATPEKRDFKYRNIRRCRLTTTEMDLILKGGTFETPLEDEMFT